MTTPYFDDIDNPEALLGKINISAFRLLFIYLLLGQTSRMSFKDLNNHLLNHPLIQNTLTLETIDQYVRTLRVFGCDINRYESRDEMIYEMADHPLKLSLTPGETEALKKILQTLIQHPLPALINNYHGLLARLLKPQHLALFQDILDQSRIALDNKVRQYQQYCMDGQFLEFEYTPQGHPPELMLIAPEEVVFKSKLFYLLGTNPRTSKRHRLRLSDIHHPRQLPSRISVSAVKTTVVFKLTGRLAHNYKPYPGETLQKRRDHLLVSHTTEEPASLIRRLMKYDTACEILSPTSAKQEIRDRIEHLLQTAFLAEKPESAPAAERIH